MRELDDWISTFLAYTEGVVSPLMFREWAAVGAISAALQRKVWTRIRRKRLYPNIYVLLVAKPGIGKTNAIVAAKSIVQRVDSVILAPQSITEQSFYMELERSGLEAIAKQKRQSLDIQCAMTAMIDEFGTLVRGDDSGFMNFLTDVYDCPDVYDYRTKGSGSNHIEQPCLTIIGGCTPMWIKEIFTDAALEKGFPARIIMVYSEEEIHTPLFDEDSNETSSDIDPEMARILKKDLEDISKMEGHYSWSPEAGKAFSEWVEGGMLPKPLDPRLEHYNTRRVVHVAKLSMILRASRGEGSVIDVEDITRAQDMLLQTERHMPGAIQMLGSNPHFAQMGLMEKIVKLHFIRTKKAITEAELRTRLAREVPIQYTDTLIMAVVASGAVQASGQGRDRLFLPPAGFDPTGEPPANNMAIARATRKAPLKSLK